MEKHPDCEPGRAVSVHSRYDDDTRSNEQFESDWIYGLTPKRSFLKIARC